MTTNYIHEYADEIKFDEFLKYIIESKPDTTYVPLLNFEYKYFIQTEFPFIITLGRGERVLEEIMKNNCPHVKLNGKLYKKHELIAKQFIPNPNNYKFVKHINHNKFDYHIDNLCWTNDSRCVRYTPSGIIY